MKLLKLELTNDQKEKLSAHFEAVKRGNEKGIRTAIAGQIYKDGIVVKLIHGEAGAALSKAMGGDWDVCHPTANSRIAAG